MNRLLLFLTFLITSLGAIGSEPEVLYLSWIHDPSSTMLIQWHTENNDKGNLIYYKAEWDTEWHLADGSHLSIPHRTVLVHKVEVVNLQPDTKYQFRIGKRGKIYCFRTMPKELNRAIRFIVGGDAYMRFRRFHKMNKRIAKQNPDFIVLGGDIAYANDNHHIYTRAQSSLQRWQTFFSEYKDTLVNSDGCLIPLIAVVGNHDVKNGKKAQELFFKLFTFPEKLTAYRALDFNNYLSLILLDTGHLDPIAGLQTEWLRSALQERQGRNNLAIYHIAAYPSNYSYKSSDAATIRKNWVPLFEEYKVPFVFEHHNHTFKRTYPIKKNLVDADGIIYLGDGSWGVPPRTVFPEKKTWYLEKSARSNCVWQVELSEKGYKFKAFNEKGKIIDAFDRIGNYENFSGTAQSDNR